MELDVKTFFKLMNNSCEWSLWLHKVKVQLGDAKMHPVLWMTILDLLFQPRRCTYEVLNVVFIWGINEACMQMDEQPRPTYSICQLF